MYIFFFFFNDTATTEIYTLSLHDALPISGLNCQVYESGNLMDTNSANVRSEEHTSELQSRFGISYAVFCLKKKNYPVVSVRSAGSRPGRCRPELCGRS